MAEFVIPTLIWKGNEKPRKKTFSVNFVLSGSKISGSHWDTDYQDFTIKRNEKLFRNALKYGDVSFMINIKDNKKRDLEKKQIDTPCKKKRRLNNNESIENKNNGLDCDESEDDEDKTEIKCFSHILVAESPFFEAALMNNNFAESKDKQFTFRGSYDNCYHFIQFVVTGIINEEANMVKMLKLSHEYQVPRLQSVVAKNILHRLQIRNFPYTTQLWDRYKIKDEYDILINWGKEHISQLKTFNNKQIWNQLTHTWKNLLEH